MPDYLDCCLAVMTVAMTAVMTVAMMVAVMAAVLVIQKVPGMTER